LLLLKPGNAPPTLVVLAVDHDLLDIDPDHIAGIVELRLAGLDRIRRGAYCTDRSVQYTARVARHETENTMKTAIVVLSDPKSGGEEALGRVFNALAAAYDLKQKQLEVEILFQGAGTRWAGQLTRPEHPAHALYAAVERLCRCLRGPRGRGDERVQPHRRQCGSGYLGFAQPGEVRLRRLLGPDVLNGGPR
jgi:hypothetical protein